MGITSIPSGFPVPLVPLGFPEISPPGIVDVVTPITFDFSATELPLEGYIDVECLAPGVATLDKDTLDTAGSPVTTTIVITVR